MTKDEARDEVLRRWHALPDEECTFEQAQVLAAAFAEQLDFRTMGNARKVIAAWLVQDLGGAVFGEDGPRARRVASRKTVNAALRRSVEAGRTS